MFTWEYKLFYYIFRYDSITSSRTRIVTVFFIHFNCMHQSSRHSLFLNTVRKLPHFLIFILYFYCYNQKVLFVCANRRNIVLYFECKHSSPLYIIHRYFTIFESRASSAINWILTPSNEFSVLCIINRLHFRHRHIVAAGQSALRNTVSYYLSLLLLSQTG